MPRKLKQMCASLVHRELLLESLQQEKSSSALSGAQSHKCLNYDWTTKFIFCPLEQNLIGAKMPWSEGAQSRANKHSCSVNLVKSQSGRERHLQLSAGSILSKHPSHAWQADWYIMSLKTTLAWSVQDLAVVWTCISSSPSAAQTSELGDLRSTSQRDHELRQLLTGIFESTRRNQHAAPLHHASLPMLPSPKVRWPVAASLEQLAPPTHQCHEFRKPKLWMEHNGTMMNWWILCFPYHILCSLVFQLSAAEPNQCLDLPRILDVTLVSSDGQKARVPPVTHQSLRLQLLQLLHLGLKLPQHPKWVASSFAESSLYYVIVQLRERERHHGK